MSQIKIHVNDVRAENKAFKRMIGRIGDERDELSSIRRRLDGDITRRRNIDSRMSQAGSKLNDVQTRLQALYHFIEYGMDAYIQADDIARDHPFEKKKKKSIWDKIGGAINAATDGVTGFVEGVAEAVIGTVEGIFNMIAHPIQTIQGLVYVVTHPVDVAVGIWTAVSESWNNDVVNGDAQSRGKWFGRMIGEVALAAVGTKGVDKIGKLVKGSKIVQEAAGVRIVPDALRSRLPGGKWQTGSPGKPEVEGTSLHLPREEKVKPPRSNNPDEEIKKRVLQNIERSKTARESSKFDEYLRKEKELLTEIEKKKVLEGTGETATKLKAAKLSSEKIDLEWLPDKYTAVEVKGAVKVAGKEVDVSRRVYQIEIDKNYNPKDPSAAGMSNKELMEKGRAPYVIKDGEESRVELHHLIQREPGGMVEIAETTHDKYSSALHGLVEDGNSFRNDPDLEKQYNNFRSNYWKMRANE
ncbi:HNH/ENDO VII family nuclease [Cohnella panacarvi]|uniref:HNH/ENDO VII family nuclease n=1 Tax=Cohnella panacarvi TaxID=400776 RepID=UPI00047C5FC6|nr:HNH/ENDO VII family nuclease [Cohnella panacarvi]